MQIRVFIIRDGELKLVNVLFLLISFPDINKDSNLHSDLAEEFRNNGHQVYVATLLEKKHNQNTSFGSWIKSEKLI